MLCMSSAAVSQVRGEYSPGSTLTAAGTLPVPGFSYYNQFWYNSTDRLYDNHGKLVSTNILYYSLSDNNTITYVPKASLFGAKMQFLIDIAISQGKFDSKDPFNGDNVVVGDVGISNTNFIPFGLGWSFRRLDIQTALSVYAPTGFYRPHDPANLSSGFWTIGWQAGATVNLASNKSTQFSLYEYYAWNTRKSGTHDIPGQNISLDYSLYHTFTFKEKWQLMAGPAGYGQWQTTDNQRRKPDHLRYAIDAVGITTNLNTPYKGFYIGTSVLWEYGARNTYEGRTNVITGGFNF